MVRRALASLLVVGLVAPAAADPRTVQVLLTQGKVDEATRAKIDAGILTLAKIDATATAGDITFSEAAAVVGCKPDAPACREQIREMLGVDEVVYAVADKQSGGLDVTVFRVGKGGTTRDMKTSFAAGVPVERLDGVAPLFMTSRPAPTPPPEPTPPPAPAPSPTPAPTPPPLVDNTLGGQPAIAPSPTPAQPQVDAPAWKYRRLELTGMIGGGALVFVGLMCWGAASDLQGQIDEAPTATRAQIDALKDLESRGDTYSALGNVLFLGGAVVGGISTYYFMKDRRRARASMTAMPTVIDHGAGFAIGGTL